MKRVCLALLGALAITAPALAQTTASPPAERVVQNAVVIAAPAKALWGAFTDPAAYRAWAGGVAAVDLRIGGLFETSYEPAGHVGDPANLRHRIVAFVPERLIVFQNLQAPGLPDEALYRGTAIVVQYEPLGERSTRVTVSHVGFGAGAGYDRLSAFFGRGDAAMLKTLKAAYEKAG
jgi:uncharacterized protein YndB with AHSA1/START domain